MNFTEGQKFILVGVVISTFTTLYFGLSNNWLFLDGVIITGIHIIIVIPIIVYGFYKIIEEIYSKRTLRIVIIPLLGTIISILMVVYFDRLLERTDVKIRANYDGDYNGISLTLYENDEFEVHDFSALGGEYYKGTYTIKDSCLTLQYYSPNDRIKVIGNQFKISKDIITPLMTDSNYKMKIIKSK